MQLVAYGAQDVYITGNPQVTFFKLVYRRHTNFAQETIEQNFSGTTGFGRKAIATLSRNGDLVHRIWLKIDVGEVSIPVASTFRWLNWLGHVMINWVEFEIGGQKIDRQYGEWMHIYSELTTKQGHKQGYANMVGNVPKLVAPIKNTNTVGEMKLAPFTLYVPLQFYFCRNPGLCLPLVALQYHEVKVTVEMRAFEDCCFAMGTKPQAPDVQSTLLVDYIFLDTDERRRFAQVSHEYLITQIQFTGEEINTGSVYRSKLSFNHPTKEIVWVSQKQSLVQDDTVINANMGKQWYNYTTKADKTWLFGMANDANGGGMWGSGIINDNLYATLSNAGSGSNFFQIPYDTGINPTAKAVLQLNGHDRFAERDGRWFNLCIPYATHENIPSTGINVYNFALRPEEQQPSGSLNFSRIDSAILRITHDQETASEAYIIKVYAVSYNILRVLSGMGGMAYSD